MKILFRTLAFAAAAAVTLTPAAHAQSERLTLTVAAPVRIAQQTLAPGAYEIEQTPARGVFEVKNKETAHRFFLNSVSVSEASVNSSPRPLVEVERDANGQLTITAVYFPQSGLTYRFSFAGPEKEASVRAALKH